MVVRYVRKEKASQSKTVEEPSYHQGKKNKDTDKALQLMRKANRVGRTRLHNIFERRLEETARRSRLTCRRLLSRSSTIDRNNRGKNPVCVRVELEKWVGDLHKSTGIREQRRPDHHRNILHLQSLPSASIRRCICQRSRCRDPILPLPWYILCFYHHLQTPS